MARAGFVVAAVMLGGPALLLAAIAFKLWREHRAGRNVRRKSPPITIVGVGGDDPQLFTRLFGHEGGDHWAL